MKKPTKERRQKDWIRMKREYEKRHNIEPYDLDDTSFVIKASCEEYKEIGESLGITYIDCKIPNGTFIIRADMSHILKGKQYLFYG